MNQHHKIKKKKWCTKVENNDKYYKVHILHYNYIKNYYSRLRIDMPQWGQYWGQ